MTAAQIATVARFITNTNSTTVSDANFLRLLSERCKQFVIQLSKLKEDYALEVSTTPLVSLQEEYPMPLDSIRLKRLQPPAASFKSAPSCAVSPAWSAPVKS